MDTTTLVRTARNGQVPLLLALSRSLITPAYRAAFLTTAASRGVLSRLAVRPCDPDTLAAALGVTGDVGLLRDWLDIGVRLGDLAWGDGAYRLRSRLARALARPGSEAAAAALDEVVRFHLPVLMEAPSLLRDGRRLSLDSQDGAVIARSSLVLRPFVEEAVRWVLDRRSAVRMLEVGCGSGTYVRYAASLNPRLTAVALDMQADVAELAAANLAGWGLTDRVEVRHGDLRALDLQPQFDLVTMHNTIYYVPVADRAKVLERARSLLAPGGTLLLTTTCRGGGGTVGGDVLNLWFEYADFGGPLPREDELVGQLTAAGFTGIRSRRLIPGGQVLAFAGTNPPATRP